MTFRSSKTFEHAFSCAFRQPGASSHCNLLHGYALSSRFDFEGPLDDRHWVVDFGATKPLKEMLEDQFDHKTIVAENDPHLDWFVTANARRILDLRILPAVGVEAFSKRAYEIGDMWLNKIYKGADARRRGTRIVKVEVWEHPANSAIFVPG